MSALSLRWSIAAGLLALGCLLGGVLVWSLASPIASATLAAGTVVVESSRKLVQHPDGGIVKEILVHEGDFVQAGQALLRFDDTRISSAFVSVRRLLAMTVAQIARLEAERTGATRLPSPLTSAPELEGFQTELADQLRIFEARHATLQKGLFILSLEAKQNRSTARSLYSQAEREEVRARLVQQQLSGAVTLAKDGFGTKNHVIDLSSRLLELQNEIAGIRSRAEEAEQKAERAEAETSRTSAGFRETAEVELQQAMRDRIELSDRLHMLAEQQTRLASLAPASGQVVNLSAHTVGGLVSPGSTIMEIVPADDPLVIAAQVRPVDIDNVRIGLKVDIRLEGFLGHHLPRLLGTVVHVSADQLVSRADTKPYFEVRVRADRDALAAAGETLRPGMPVTLMIKTGEQTALEYFTRPILGFFARAMRS